MTFSFGEPQPCVAHHVAFWAEGLKPHQSLSPGIRVGVFPFFVCFDRVLRPNPPTYLTFVVRSSVNFPPQLVPLRRSQLRSQVPFPVWSGDQFDG